MTEDEDWARRQLHRIGDADLPLAGIATADRVIARHRRARATALAVAAAIVLAVSVPVALAATRPAPQAPIGGTTGSRTDSLSPSRPAPLTSAALAPGNPGVTARSGPARAELGVAYPFDLYSHCGIRWARFTGRWWAAVHPAPDPVRLPNSAGITTYSGYVAGTMVLVRPDLLRFTLTDRYAAGAGRSFDFVPTSGPQFRCD